MIRQLVQSLHLSFISFCEKGTKNLPQMIAVRINLKNTGGRGHMHTYGCFTLLYGRDQHNIVLQLKILKNISEI